MMATVAKPKLPRERFYALDAKKREQLLGPAETEFAANGFNGASLNRILVKAGMSKGQAYYYFRNKADLYRLVCEHVFERLSLAIGGWSINDDTPEAFWTSVDHLFMGVMSVCMTDVGLAEIGRSVYSSSEAYQALSEPLGHLQTFMSEAVSSGQAIGAIRTDMPSDLLSSLLFAQLGALDRWFAVNMTTLEPSELIRLNNVNRQLFRDIASPRTTGLETL